MVLSHTVLYLQLGGGEVAVEQLHMSEAGKGQLLLDKMAEPLASGNVAVDQWRLA